MARYQSEDEIRAEKIEKLGEECGQLYFELWKECVWLHTKWREYEALFEDKKRVEVLNRAAPFAFFMIQQVIVEDVVLHLARLTDPPRSRGKANLTVRSLPGLLDDSAVSTAVRRKVEEVGKAVEFARERRNRRLAHLDIDTVRDQHPEPLKAVSSERINTALRLLAELLNEIEQAYLGSSVYYHDGMRPRGGAHNLVQKIAAGVYFLGDWNDRLRRGEADPRERRHWQI